MAEGVMPTYTLRNFGNRSNCTLTALFPAVVAIKELTVGPPSKDIRFQCPDYQYADHLDIGGSPGLDSINMQVASTACGVSSENGIAVAYIVYISPPYLYQPAACFRCHRGRGASNFLRRHHYTTSVEWTICQQRYNCDSTSE